LGLAILFFCLMATAAMVLLATEIRAPALGHGNFQFDDFIPLGLGLLIVRDGLQFLQALLRGR